MYIICKKSTVKNAVRWIIISLGGITVGEIVAHLFAYMTLESSDNYITIE